MPQRRKKISARIRRHVKRQVDLGSPTPITATKRSKVAIRKRLKRKQ